MTGKVLKMDNMRKINNSAIMNKNAENPELCKNFLCFPLIKLILVS